MRFDHDTLSSRVMVAEERRRNLARALHEPDPMEAFHAQLAIFRARASALHERLVSSRLFDLQAMRDELEACTAKIEHAASGIERSAQRYRADLAAIRRQMA